MGDCVYTEFESAVGQTALGQEKQFGIFEMSKIVVNSDIKP